MRFDGALVHVGAVEVGDLALRRIAGGGGLALAASSMMLATRLLDEVGEDAEDADSGAVGGEFGAGDEAAVGVEVEVVAGLDGRVDVGDGDAVGDRECQWLEPRRGLIEAMRMGGSGAQSN